MFVKLECCQEYAVSGSADAGVADQFRRLAQGGMVIAPLGGIMILLSLLNILYDTQGWQVFARRWKKWFFSMVKTGLAKYFLPAKIEAAKSLKKLIGRCLGRYNI